MCNSLGLKKNYINKLQLLWLSLLKKQIKLIMYVGFPGDCCATGETKLAVIAQEHAKHLASNLVRHYQGKPMKPYRPSIPYFCVINNARRYSFRPKLKIALSSTIIYLPPLGCSSFYANCVCSIVERNELSFSAV